MIPMLWHLSLSYFYPHYSLHCCTICLSWPTTEKAQGMIETEGWVGVSPPAVLLNVGWNSLFSTDYSFIKAHIFFQRVSPLQVFIIHKEPGNTRWISSNLRNKTGDCPHAKPWQKEICSSNKHTRIVATGVLCEHTWMYFTSTSFANAAKTLKTIVIIDRVMQYTQF